MICNHVGASSSLTCDWCRLAERCEQGIGGGLHLNHSLKIMNRLKTLKVWIVNLMNVDGLKARQLVRIERDEDVAD
jgi:hypothetical protein